MPDGRINYLFITFAIREKANFRPPSRSLACFGTALITAEIIQRDLERLFDQQENVVEKSFDNFSSARLFCERLV